MAVVDRETTELEAFEDFCAKLRLEDGRPMRLEPFQKTILADFFNGAREVLALLPKGNAKSTLLAILAVFEVLTNRDAEVIIVAAARDQAAIMLRQAAGLVRRSPALQQRLAIKQREIVHRQHAGRIRVLASDVDTSDGAIPTLVLFDELHRHRREELYSLMRASLAKRDGRMVVISTAGDNEESPLGQLRTRAYSLPIQQRDGAYRRAASPDGAFCMHEWALDAGQDLDDIDLVKTANPLSSVTLEKLRERHDSPSTTPWAWARFTCGAWVRGEHSAIRPEDWDALEDPTALIPPGSPIYVGLDLAWRGRDTTAIVPLAYQSEAVRILGDPVIFKAEAGEMVDDREIKAAIVDLAQRFDVRAVVFDPAGAAAVAQQLEREHGLTLVEHQQRESAMAQADSRLLLAIRQKQIRHTGHRELREHVLNAVEHQAGGELLRFVRPKGPRVPIDALTALSMAHNVAVSEAIAPPPPPAPSRDWYLL